MGGGGGGGGEGVEERGIEREGGRERVIYCINLDVSAGAWRNGCRY